MLDVDDSRFPLVFFTATGVSLEAVSRYIEETERLMTRGRYAEIISTGGIPLPPVKVIKRYADWGKQCKERLEERIVATAFVAPSAVLRGALNFLGRLDTNAVPEQLFGTKEGATQWATELLRNAKLL